MNQTTMQELPQRQATSVPEQLLNVREMATRLGVSTRQVWKLASSGRLPAPIRLGRSVRWRESDLDRFIALGCPAREEFEAVVAVAKGVAQ